ncbi:MAG: DUF371 domain-containing protein [Nitrososphaerales archaeon]
MEEEILFYGHPNITALHKKSIEVTKAKNIMLKGDCIIGVNASKACNDLCDALKRKLKEKNSMVRMSIIVGKHTYEFVAYGSSSLILTNKHDIVVRKTRFVCPRTLAIACDSASSDIPKSIVHMLKDPSVQGSLRISVK